MPRHVPIIRCLMFAFAVILPMLVVAAESVLPRIVQGDAAAAKAFRDYVDKSAEISPVVAIVGYRKDVTETNRLASLPPSSDWPVLRSCPLSPDEQAALTNLLIQAQPGSTERGQQVAQFELKLVRGSKTLYVWCHGGDVILFRVFDNKRQEFLAPETELVCPGVTRFVERVLGSAVRAEEGKRTTLWLNPQGGANGRQPGSSEANRTSAAAASVAHPEC